VAAAGASPYRSGQLGQNVYGATVAEAAGYVRDIGGNGEQVGSLGSTRVSSKGVCGLCSLDGPTQGNDVLRSRGRINVTSSSDLLSVK